MENKEQLIDEAKRIEEDAIYSAKGHFYASGCWSKVHLWLGSAAAIVSAIAGTLALSNYGIIGGILAMIVAVLTAISTFIAPQEKSSSHLKSGNKYNALRNDSRIFHNIDVNSTNTEKAHNDLKKLNARRNKLNTESPQIPRWAFKKGRDGIENGDRTIDKNNYRRRIRK